MQGFKSADHGAFDCFKFAINVYLSPRCLFQEDFFIVTVSTGL